jgi:hypothetical protein
MCCVSIVFSTASLKTEQSRTGHLAPKSGGHEPVEASTPTVAVHGSPLGIRCTWAANGSQPGAATVLAHYLVNSH